MAEWSGSIRTRERNAPLSDAWWAARCDDELGWLLLNCLEGAADATAKAPSRRQLMNHGGCGKSDSMHTTALRGRGE